MIKHIRRWNIWRKHCLNGSFHKFLVLIGFKKSPSMMFILLPEEWQKAGIGSKKYCSRCGQAIKRE